MTRLHTTITEQSLQDNKTPDHLLIDILPVAIYICDQDGRITFFNEAAANLWGRRPELEKDLWCGSWKIYNPDGITELPLQEFPMALVLKKRGHNYDQEIIIEQPDGTRKHILAQPQPIHDSDGRLIGAINILIDITEKKTADRRNAMLAAIIQSSSDAIISKTLDGIITSWNPTAEKMFGYSSEEMVGQPINILIPPDRADEEPHILSRLKRGESIEHFETKRITKHGKTIDISLTISPIRDKNGHIIGASKIARDISAQKQLHEALQQSEERLRMASQSAHLGTWEYHPDTRKLIWSDECKKIYGLDPDKEPIADDVASQNHPDDQETISRTVKAAMDPLDPTEFILHYRIYRKNDQQLRWINVRGRFYFKDGKAERFIGTMRDITDEKNREHELKQSVELFQTMADNVPAMIWMSGDDKFNDYFNKTWLEFTGKTMEEECEDGWLNGVHPEDVQKCVSTYQTALQQQIGFYIEYRLRRYDGQYHWVSDNCVPRFSHDGKFSGFISACMDIDDQKRFSEKITESELLFKTISNASPVGLWMTDSNAQNIFVNHTWIDWTGIPFEKQLGTGWLDRVVSEDKDITPSRFRESMAKKEKFSTEFRIIRKDGKLRCCLTEGYPYYDINGKFSGYAGSVTDITEIRELEQRKDDFIKMASHELKTPITSIKGYVQLLMDIFDEKDEAKLTANRPLVLTSLGTISKQVTKLTRLVSELLDLTKIESGKLELFKTEFDPAGLVDEMVRDMQQTPLKHNIVVHNEFRGLVYADKDRIAQVLLNLLTNAIKYSPGRKDVEVKITGNDHTLSVSVTDHGIGIDPAEHQKIFERFYRVEGKNEQTYPGFGIGLFIATEIMQRHGGNITVHSEKGKGSVFTFNLPILFQNDLHEHNTQ